MINKRPLGDFLRLNPFERGWTDGLFYREKMRAIHRIAPSALPGDAKILEIGGGRSGLAAMLFPGAEVVTLDIDASLAPEQPNNPNTRFVTGDACDLPFEDASFDIATMFDLLEHGPDDHKAASEAMRVVKRGGAILVSTPDAEWRYPYYGFMTSLCPHEQDLMDEWGHVRRGYRAQDLNGLFGGEPFTRASFINGVTAFYHDVAFSKLGKRKRKLLYAAMAAPTAVAYALHGRSTKGTEHAAAWRR